MREPSTRPAVARVPGALMCVLMLGFGGACPVRADELSDAISKADRLDPGWRLEQIFASRKDRNPPDAKNSAVQAKRALKLLPSAPKRAAGAKPPTAAELPRRDRLWTAIMELEPAAPLPADLSAELRAEMTERAGAVAELRKLADMPAGQVLYTPVKNPLEILLPYEQETRQLARLLRLDVERRLVQKDHDGAAASTIAIVNLSRSIGDAPFLVSQVIRMAIDQVAMQSVARVLNLGSPSERALARLQECLEKEADVPRLLCGIRGERALQFEVVKKLNAGDLRLADLVPGSNTPAPEVPPDLLVKGYFPHNQARALSSMSELVEILKGPADRRQSALDLWLSEHEIKKKNEANQVGDSLFYRLMPAVAGIIESEQRTVCVLRSAAAACACVRSHLATRRWPESLRQLVPTYLKSAPLDPFVGEPLRFKRQPDAILIYGTGVDRRDDGGRLNLKPLAGYDVGVSIRAR